MKQRFVQIPFPWVRAAMQTSRTDARVVLILWWQAFRQRTRRTVRVSRSQLRELGIDRRTYARVLRVLERAELVQIRRAPGKGFVVTILEKP